MSHATGEPLGRPTTLDFAKRQTILSMLANGSSRRTAAAFVGCSASTITRTAARDPDFEAALCRAEQRSEIHALRCLQNAAENHRYWRAAAWLLERKNPIDFALRQPDVFTGDQMRQMLSRLLIYLTDDMPDSKYDKVLARMDALAGKIQRDGKLPPPPPPVLHDASLLVADFNDAGPISDEPDEPDDDEPDTATAPSAGEVFATLPPNCGAAFPSSPSVLNQ